MRRRSIHLAATLLTLAFPCAASEESGPWTGTENEILQEATRPLVAYAEVRIRNRFHDLSGEISLERKLWVILDFLVEDEGRNYGATYYNGLFSTIASDRVASEYSVQRVHRLAKALIASSADLERSPPPTTENQIFVVGGPFQDEILTTTEEALSHQRRVRFTCDILVGILNVLWKHDRKGGEVLAQHLMASKVEEVALVGRAYPASHNETE